MFSIPLYADTGVVFETAGCTIGDILKSPKYRNDSSTRNIEIMVEQIRDELRKERAKKAETEHRNRRFTVVTVGEIG